MSGLWAALRDRCPLQRTSPNAPDVSSVVGSFLLAVLAGGNRYRHMDALRGDTVLPELLGMEKIVSADSMRRAVVDLAADESGHAWVADMLLETLLPVVRQGPWILNLDSTVVTVYGKQAGSAVGYNPTKKGRPSSSYHAFIIGGLRLPIDADARPGNESQCVHGAEALWHLLDQRLPVDTQPWYVRGDISWRVTHAGKTILRITSLHAKACSRHDGTLCPHESSEKCRRQHCVAGNAIEAGKALGRPGGRHFCPIDRRAGWTIAPYIGNSPPEAPPYLARSTSGKVRF